MVHWFNVEMLSKLHSNKLGAMRTVCLSPVENVTAMLEIPCLDYPSGPYVTESGPSFGETAHVTQVSKRWTEAGAASEK